MNEVLSEFLNAFIPALIPLLVAGVAWVAKAIVGFIKSRTSAEQYALLSMLAKQAVAAAQQTMKSEAGAKKREAAIAAVRGALLAKGIRLDEEAIAGAVEAAVYAQILAAPQAK